ncbi:MULTISPECIES: RagB/SusD family nutrient uptake outer membrane protein [unclassified Dysgonomonas]|uniref:RagB/SusD family nutrient uptake outer membrane protein n=1 Tax=unclassified Dysgonomonas TaxID=2630389 RepID=UPI0025B81E05|nr:MULTISPECIES: RagB/SusD family nutrient uptake outer membrane protein [unclassified Dysgonomonas]HMM02782.1 RagB/SusD family nutrient uptake outer membrane protein [Dysgonomonas sp.]
MKNKFYNIARLILLGALVIVTIPSCNDMLEEKKFDFVQPNDIADSDDGATQWVMGTYNLLIDDMFRWSVFPAAFDFDCDYISGPDWAFKNFGAGNFQSIDETKNMWEKPYVIIHRANYAMENINKMSNVTPRYKENVIGELRFLKAYSYFLLVRAFGEVPIRKESINATGEVNIPRSSVEDVYAYIIELLKDAEMMMYKNTDPGFVEGRASAGAAASLLAKVYATMASGAMPAGNDIKVKGGLPFVLEGSTKVYTDPVAVTVKKKQLTGYDKFDYKEYYGLARDKAKQVMDGVYGTYGLLPYDNLWKKESWNKTEHIWMLQAISGDPKFGMAYTVGYAGIYDSDGNIFNGLWYGMRDHWYKLFESKDYRVEKGVLHRWARNFDVVWNIGSFYPNTEEYRKKALGYTDEQGNEIPPQAPYNDGLRYTCNRDAAFLAFLTKYDDRTDKTIERSDAHWPFLRYADVVLIYAEAEAEVNGAPDDAALEALNKIRRRSNATEKTLTGLGNIGSLVDFRSAVLEERAMEFALEGDRRWDLIRWGIYVDVMNSIGGTDESGIYKVRSSKHELFPIPNSEMDSNKAIKENNPGWS